MAAPVSAPNLILRKTVRMFQAFKRVDILQFTKRRNPAVVFGILSRCSHYQNNLSLTLHSRLYFSAQKSQLNHSCLPASFCQPCSRCFSTPTEQKAPEGSSSEEKPEELDTLYKSIELKIKGHDEAVLDSYKAFVSMAAKELGVTLHSVSKPLRKIERLTLLKSRHIYKKHRVQYEIRTHFRILEFKHITGSTADVFLEYVERNLPEGVALKVTKCALEKLPDHLQSPPETNDESSFLSSSMSSSDSSSSEDDDTNLRDTRE
ncbi:probable 28S ribosomal protein S10, mitochondrial [Acanthaster planci]|uniref:Small ribosomal subunit protein uS10m n=1 Tax=Acanthaster planci TaxID=133434 RepID=A0A8B7Y709_ACAPL|nr:probable 28S ribosomal protein S10, mitochondrial [Acanthaster planci]